MIIQLTEEEYKNMSYTIANEILDSIVNDDLRYITDQSLAYRLWDSSWKDNVKDRLDTIIRQYSQVAVLRSETEKQNQIIEDLQQEMVKLRSPLHQTLSGTDESNAQPTAPKKTFIKTWFK